MLSSAVELRAVALCAETVLLCLVLGGCAGRQTADYLPRTGAVPSSRQGRIEYSFGVLPLHNAVRLFEIYQPFVDEINGHLDGFSIRMETAKDHPRYEMKVRNRELDFVMMNPHLVIPAEENGYLIIGRTANKIRGLILVRKDSKIRRASDLRGTSISFSSRTDLPGAMMQKLLLRQNGLDVDRQANPKYVGSPESALENVFLERSAAACVSDGAWHLFRARSSQMAEALEVRWTTVPLVGRGVLARNDIPREHVEQVGRALFHLNKSAQGRKILEPMHISGFTPASEASYDPIWEFQTDYLRLFGRVPTLGGAE